MPRFAGAVLFPAALGALFGQGIGSTGIAGHIVGLLGLLAGMVVGFFIYGALEVIRGDDSGTDEDRPIGPLSAVMACYCGVSLGMHTGGIVAGIFGAASFGATAGGVAGGLFGGWLIIHLSGPQVIVVTLATLAAMLGGSIAAVLVLGEGNEVLPLAGLVIGYFAGRFAGVRLLLPLVGRVMAHGPEWAYDQWVRGELLWNTEPVGHSEEFRRREQSQSQDQGRRREQQRRREEQRQREERDRGGEQRQREQRRQQESRRREQAATSLVDAYRTLDVSPSATDAEVKTAYRRLMHRYHPDKFAAKELPEEMMRVAHERTQRIQAAWEAIKTARAL